MKAARTRQVAVLNIAAVVETPPGPKGWMALGPGSIYALACARWGHGSVRGRLTRDDDEGENDLKMIKTMNTACARQVAVTNVAAVVETTPKPVGRPPPAPGMVPARACARTGARGACAR